MTKTEAIEILQPFRDAMVDQHGCPISDAVYALDVAIETLKQPEQRWIPCSERLPIIKTNIGTRVLITTSWGLVKEAHYCVDHWEVDGISYKLTSATAWMPLPEPWKGESDG